MAVNLVAIAGLYLGGVMNLFGLAVIFWLNIPIGIFVPVPDICISFKGNYPRKPIRSKNLILPVQSLYCIGLATILLALTIGDPPFCT